MMSTVTNPYNAIIYALIQVLIAGLSALISVIIAYGAVASSIVGLLGPIFIPFLVFDKLDFLFWGWLRAFLGFSFLQSGRCRNVEHPFAICSRITTPSWRLRRSGDDGQELPMLILLVSSSTASFCSRFQQ